jgi:U4/U6.U5 tri-snRNP-associated protein 1
MADLSVEEANKIRLSMGMAPLPVPGAAASGPAFKPAAEGIDPDEEPASTVETRQAAAYDNWQKLQDEEEAKKKREQRVATIKKAQEKASRFSKLEGKGLADEANDEDDLAWLKGSKKRAKKIAKAEQTQRELEERERQAREALQYTEADLAGVKVGHEVDQFDDGEDQILVLKDTAVDAEDDDELEAVSLKERERLQEKLDSKKRKRAYDPNDNEDGPKSILAQYDEEIDGKKRKAFTLDGQGRTVEDIKAEAAGITKPKRVAISLDILQDDTPVNDYMDISEVKMKKPKKKKSKSSKRRRTEDDDEMMTVATEDANKMELDESETAAPKPRKKAHFDESFVDDDDLQAQLAAQRRQALKKRKKMRPEDLARQLREDSAPETPGVMDSTELGGEDAGTLVIDETTEFVHNLGAHAEDEEEIQRRQRRKSSHVSGGIASVGEANVDDEGDVNMDESYAALAEAEDRSQLRTQATEISGTGLDDEKTIDQGLGATLALLKQRGVIASVDSDDRNAAFRERQKFLAEKQRAEESAERLRKEHRERERNSARWNNMTPREREEWARKNNVAADHVESRKLADIFNKDYKPNVELNYVDEHGRQLNEKEAFKMLSHQFHGKGSGNTKTKKHLDKIAGERRKLAESSLEATRAGGLNSALDHASKKNKFAGVRLQ